MNFGRKLFFLKFSYNFKNIIKFLKISVFKISNNFQNFIKFLNYQIKMFFFFSKLNIFTQISKNFKNSNFVFQKNNNCEKLNIRFHVIFSAAILKIPYYTLSCNTAHNITPQCNMDQG